MHRPLKVAGTEDSQWLYAIMTVHVWLDSRSVGIRSKEDVKYQVDNTKGVQHHFNDPRRCHGFFSHQPLSKEGECKSLGKSKHDHIEDAWWTNHNNGSKNKVVHDPRNRDALAVIYLYSTQ